jgi:hypothetical protein
MLGSEITYSTIGTINDQHSEQLNVHHWNSQEYSTMKHNF